jgi:hypothetical protein
MYKLKEDLENREVIQIIRINDWALIPLDEKNRDYQEYLEWLAQGNEPEPADE